MLKVYLYLLIALYLAHMLLIDIKFYKIIIKIATVNVFIHNNI